MNRFCILCMLCYFENALARITIRIPNVNHSIMAVYIYDHCIYLRKSLIETNTVGHTFGTYGRPITDQYVNN